ncbi:unnamed protein product [Brassica napus]|uniref:(rape) hypothetical protein n=1 Tax=Brassica napus TaxID=3708 RepID=A0A816YW03_BRANA|nr:unnamed protein product [Brassica napus]
MRKLGLGLLQSTHRRKNISLARKLNCSVRSRSSPLGQDNLRKCKRELIYIRKTRTSKKGLKVIEDEYKAEHRVEHDG